ncbi:6-carboxytetrahydropterin synthase QueD [Sporolactobacillus sp. THM7-7]|nr:6-carboxytetrahydropterin synthase QueD [Sporolactobacillus sp. THM7-7]
MDSKGGFFLKKESTAKHRGEATLAYHNKRVAVTKSFTFDAAHNLERYEGKCKNLHGHTYQLEITVSGYLNDIGMAVDFGEIKEMFRENIQAKLDHRYLNEVLPGMNTTAENVIVWIWEQLDRAMDARGLHDQGHRLESLRLYETPTSWATIHREWMIDHENDR